MIVYGRNAVREALLGRRSVYSVWATAKVAKESWVAGEGSTLHGGESFERLTELCGSEDHQGVCAEVASYPYVRTDDLLKPGNALIGVLDQVQDPQNLGAICRTAECAGVTGLVIPDRRAAEVTPAVCRASAGAVEHLSIAQVANIADFLTAAKEAGFWCYGADAGAQTRFDSLDYSGKVAIVLGSEGKGLRPRVAASCDLLVSLPLRGRIESLNVGVAAAVLFYTAAVKR